MACELEEFLGFSRLVPPLRGVGEIPCQKGSTIITVV